MFFEEPRADWSDEQWRAYWKANPCLVPGCNKPVLVKKWHDVVRHGAVA